MSQVTKFNLLLGDVVSFEYQGQVHKGKVKFRGKLRATVDCGVKSWRVPYRILRKDSYVRDTPYVTYTPPITENMEDTRKKLLSNDTLDRISQVQIEAQGLMNKHGLYKWKFLHR